MELFEQLRREYEFGVGSIAGVARTFGVHRRLVREALGGAIPQQRLSKGRPRPKTGAVAEFIDGILEADRRAPRKQRHTAHRIWVRITGERKDVQIAEATVRQYVRERKRATGLRTSPEVFIPQHYAWGEEGQVDWYEAQVDLDGERQKVQVFAMRAMASGAPFHRAYPRATQQAFLEAHELGFQYLGGVFRRLRYDNLSAAVRKILRGHRREETARFVAFRSHWGFAAEFCTPGEGHEKGGVEGEAGFFRRNHLVPVPAARDLDELNAMLLTACEEELGRTIDGRQQTIGEALTIERRQLLPMPAEGFDLVEVSFGHLDDKRRVKAKTNAYSAPLPPGATVQVKLAPASVEIWHQGRCVARHARSYDRHQEILDLEHYLDVLEHKPGAFAGGKPLEQWRRAGRWPVSYDQYWQALMERHGRQHGTRAMPSRLRWPADGDRIGTPVGLHGCRRRAAFDGQRRTGSSTTGPPAGYWRTDALRASAATRPGLRRPAGRDWRCAMSPRAEDPTSVRQSVIKQQCVVLRLPTIASQCIALAEQAERERQPYLSYLEALLAAELEDRERRSIDRRIKEAHLPRVKTLDEFDFRQAPTVSPTQLSELLQGGYLERAEPVVFIGDSGTGKTHLLTALCVAACRQRKRVRFTTAAALVNELVEAKQQLELRRVLGRWARYDVIAIDEVGYVPLAELGAEFLFQVIADRAERAAVLLTTNLPFSEWTQVIPNARLCKALLDRITDRAHIIETGSESYRFRRTLEQHQRNRQRGPGEAVA